MMDANGKEVEEMLKIGEFSKLSQLTVKALRFYEKAGLLLPAAIDPWTGYRMYETSQLEQAAKIKFYRKLNLSIEEIKSIQAGWDVRQILMSKMNALKQQKEQIQSCLTAIESILEGKSMLYQVTEKVIPSVIVYYSEVTLPSYSDMMRYIPQIGAECIALNPGLQCAEPPYEFCEYLDAEHRETNVRIRHNEAVTALGTENEHIHFRCLPETKVLSIFHKGAYDEIGGAYAFLMNYAAENGYTVAGLSRECYIDGIWNKETEAEWLTEIQLPIL